MTAGSGRSKRPFRRSGINKGSKAACKASDGAQGEAKRSSCTVRCCIVWRAASDSRKDRAAENFACTAGPDKGKAAQDLPGTSQKQNARRLIEAARIFIHAGMRPDCMRLGQQPGSRERLEMCTGTISGALKRRIAGKFRGRKGMTFRPGPSRSRNPSHA